MPPSTRLASSSRNSQSSRIFKNAFTAGGLNRFSTSLLERSAGFSQAMPAGSRLRVAIWVLLDRSSKYGVLYVHYWTYATCSFQALQFKLSVPCTHLNLHHLRAPKYFNRSRLFKTSEYSCVEPRIQKCQPIVSETEVSNPELTHCPDLRMVAPIGGAILRCD